MRPRVGALLRGDAPLLAEGSVYERLRRHPDVPFDPYVGTAAHTLDDRFREMLGDVHRAYLRIALDAAAPVGGTGRGLPMLLQTDTWRATAARTEASRWRGADLNLANAELVLAVAQEGRDAGGTVLVGGLLGPAGDAYDPSSALGHGAARAYHAQQAEALASAGVDLLLCATLPALSEALGLADAMGATGQPYLVGFVVRPTGRLLDGTPLDEAVAEIDEAVDPEPLGYFLNCVHPRVADAALAASPRAAGRFVGLLANTSARDPDELDGLEELETAEPGPFAAELAAVGERHGLHLLGGCCGTGDEHIAALARLLAPV
ncbi:MAG: homocysteine S-methyltransferase family protein [Gaiella sp.]